MTKLTNFIRRNTSIAARIDILRRKELPLLDPQTRTTGMIDIS